MVILIQGGMNVSKYKMNLQLFNDVLSLEEALSQEDLLVYSRNLALPNNYVHELLFPSRQVNELTVDVVKNETRLPVMAQIAELGTEAQYGSREGAKGDRISIPKIQRARWMDEKLIRTLLTGQVRRDEFEEIRRTQFDDARYLVDGIRARKEWIAMQALAFGTVSYTEGGVQLSVDFSYTAEQKPALSGTDLWSDTVNSNPLDDIQTWFNTFADKGILLTRALTSRKVLGYLLQNLTLRKAYFGDPSGSANPPQLNKSQLDTMFDSMDLPRIVTYDTQARTEDKALTNNQVNFTTSRFTPQNRFMMVPEGALGEYLWATTTEEMAAGELNIEAEMKDAGVYVFRDVKNVHPIQVRTIGVALAFPSFAWNDSVVSATVIA
jgi:hypothetical protein